MDVHTFENARWSRDRQKLEFRHEAALALIADGPVLDIGCGDGLFLSLCRDAGIEAHGVDLSEVAVAHCTEQGFKAQQVDITASSLSFPDAAFPIVIALDVLEHLYDPLLLLREMKRISAQGVLISVPNFSSLPSRLQVLFGNVPENNRPRKGHVYWFNWPVLQSLIKKSGLRIVTVRTNALWERVPGISSLSRMLANLFPNLFALSFVVRCENV